MKKDRLNVLPNFTFHVLTLCKGSAVVTIARKEGFMQGARRGSGWIESDSRKFAGGASRGHFSIPIVEGST
jgi:lipid-binding SYLF domain-containing protein